MDKEAITMVTSENQTQMDMEDERHEFSPGQRSKLKKCPFCAELIQPEAIKCRYCGEFLHGFKRKDIKSQSNDKWYYSTTALITLLCIVGPLALPLAWFNPKYKILTKIIITVVVFAATTILIYMMAEIYRQFLEQFDTLGLGGYN